MSNLKVFLDHLIPRENLRYKRSEEQLESTPQQTMTNTLSLTTLIPNRSPAGPGTLLRKPDFQRATWAWTAEDCQALLESITTGQVVPSIIMWSSPDNEFRYILDGSHRVSVLIAWLKDDWGDKLPEAAYGDKASEE